MFRETRRVNQGGAATLIGDLSWRRKREANPSHKAMPTASWGRQERQIGHGNDSKKQAIAIGRSTARQKGAKVPRRQKMIWTERPMIAPRSGTGPVGDAWEAVEGAAEDSKFCSSRQGDAVTAARADSGSSWRKLAGGGAIVVFCARDAEESARRRRTEARGARVMGRCDDLATRAGVSLDLRADRRALGRWTCVQQRGRIRSGPGRDDVARTIFTRDDQKFLERSARADVATADS